MIKSLAQTPRPTKTPCPGFFATFSAKTIPFRYAFSRKTAGNSLPAGVLPLNGGLGSDSKTFNQGFTLVELLIATTIFSVILLLAANGIVYVGRLYQKGTNGALVQEVTRSAIDEIKNDFELSSGTYKKLTDAGNAKGFCIGDNLYSYKLNTRIPADGNGHAFVVRQEPNCSTNINPQPDDISGAPNPTYPWRELLGPNMQLQSDPVTDPSGSKAINIRITVISAENDLIEDSGPSKGLCKPGFGSQFCASSSVSTYAVKRAKTP